MRQNLAEKVLYIGVADVAAKLKHIERAYGEIYRPRFEVRGVIVLGLFKDPTGNRMGLVATLNEEPATP